MTCPHCHAPHLMTIEDGVRIFECATEIDSGGTHHQSTGCRENQIAALKSEIAAHIEHLSAASKQLAGAGEIEMRLTKERDRYLNTLLARHGGECVALLEELDEARLEIARLQSEREADKVFARQSVLKDATPAMEGLCAKLDEARRLGDGLALAISKCHHETLCDSAHHDKADRHTDSEPCPVVARITESIAAWRKMRWEG